eukprot:NODE_2517_length_551_cov_161.669811_g2467_i0.p1 GENE.NODE_2517_length_551_cov_161.669811_g2467_i0~~NODE_2517_length_551_cov_161.669811_g2467_i0.p1  ORF type:complete len:123 (+),score=29.76 NODE_2517_length_551_cov_161.669811_g2467_i0:84-452(+)
MPNLICVIRFNPPVVKLMGTTLREETVQALNAKLSTVTTTSRSPKQEPPQFDFVDNPPHWTMQVQQQYCDHLGRSMMLLTCIEALEAEDWKMKASHAITHNSHRWGSKDAGMDTVRIFFTRA